MIKLLLVVVSLTLPILLFYLNIAHPEVKGGLVFSLFAILVTIVKVWESFYTSNEKGAREYHGDWTLLLTSVLYFFTGLMVILEFFIINRVINPYFMLVGLLIFFAAAILQYWSHYCPIVFKVILPQANIDNEYSLICYSGDLESQSVSDHSISGYTVYRPLSSPKSVSI